jgi:hypothetical protein
MRAGTRKELGLASTHALLRGMTAPGRQEALDAHGSGQSQEASGSTPPGATVVRFVVARTLGWAPTFWAGFRVWR